MGLGLIDLFDYVLKGLRGELWCYVKTVNTYTYHMHFCSNFPFQLDSRTKKQGPSSNQYHEVKLGIPSYLISYIM